MTVVSIILIVLIVLIVPVMMAICIGGVVTVRGVVVGVTKELRVRMATIVVIARFL